MEMSEQEMENEMDRLLELFKQLEVEKAMKEQIEKLEELAEKQEELSQLTKNEEKPSDELKKEQEKLNKEFDDLKKEQKELEKKNEELERPKDMENKDAEMEDIDQDMEKSSEELQKNQSGKASKSQKSAADKMKKMAGDMKQEMESGEQEQMAEDIKAIRQLLENLVTLSFDQEDLITDVSRANTTTPHYVDLVQHQYKLKDDFSLIRDSLEALGKRNFQIEPFIAEKVTEIEHNFSSTLRTLEDRHKGKAGESQRYVMTNVNDLALMLSESMEKMQQAMAQMMKGNQMCNKPGSGACNKPGSTPSDKITEGQKGLSDQLKKLKEGLEKKKKGQGKGGKDGMAKEFAKAAARQAAMRRALEELQKEKQEQGKGSQGLQDIIDEMDKMEIDLVNKRLDNETLKRQQDIITRLLKAEKADRQRELDEKRKAETAKEMERKLPPSLEEYIQKRKAEVEFYQKVSPSLRPYYKFLVEEYYKSLKSSSD